MSPSTATARLTFLYPHLFRSSARLGDSTTAHQVAKTRRSPACRPCNPVRPGDRAPGLTASITTSARAKQAALKRHGKAVEPLPVPPSVTKRKLPQPGDGPKGPATSETKTPQNSSSVTEGSPLSPPPPPQGTPQAQAQAAKEESSGAEAAQPKGEAKKEAKKAADAPAPEGSGPKSAGGATPLQAAAEEKMQSSGPMDAVLHMPPPSKVHHPHISTPPYVHHFDSYTLVKHLETGGYTKNQAITLMKAVRALLARNLDMAQSGLVSKTDIDNETYLFRAACSELSTEVHNNRRNADEQNRQQRTVLQHEVDITSQKLTQDLMTLRDDVRGHFNDRKMAVREEQRRMEGAIQQVNFAISVILNSDAKSEIEGLRWILIRRSVLGILFMAVLTLGTIRYATYVTHEQQKKAEEKARQAETVRNSGGHRPPPVFPLFTVQHSDIEQIPPE